MKPDVIVAHPKDIYYPYWADLMNRNRSLFGRLIIVMTSPNSDRDYTKYLKKIRGSMIINQDIQKLTAGGKDWRNIATNLALEKSDSEYVLFLEQDFLVKDKFFEKLFEGAKGYFAVGFNSSKRLHPACLLVKKEIINKTDRDFSAKPPAYDHFGLFTHLIKSWGNWTTLEELGLTDWLHLAGLTHNFRVWPPNYYPNRFYNYLVCSADLDQPEGWRVFCADIIKRMGKRLSDPGLIEYFEK